MIKVGVIEIDENYIVGERAMLYKLSKQYNTGKFKWVSATSTAFKKRGYSDVYKENIGKYVYEPRLISVLGKHFNDGLTIDKEAAYLLIDEMYFKKQKDILSGAKKLREKRLVKLRLVCNSYRSSIDRINTNATLKQDEFGHRLHTPLTALKREFRELVRYQGQRLAEVDLSNSQLFLILPLLDWKNWVVHKERRGKKSLNSTIWTGIEYITTNTNTIMFLKSLEVRYGKGLQRMQFAHDACKGIVYERLVEVLDSIGYFNISWSSKLKRGYIKRSLLALLFGSRRKHRRMYNSNMGKVWVTFKALYPEVGQLIEIIKEEDYKAISMLLQRIESFCMIRGVCKTIKNEQPHIPLFTLHDCIVTTKEYVEIVEKELLSVVTGIVGFTPTVKKKAWYNTANSFIVLISRIGNIINAIRKRAA